MRAAGRGYNTAQARSRASVVPRPTPILFSDPCCRRSAPCAAARNLVNPINPAARRKATSAHVHVPSARPEPALTSARLPRNRVFSVLPQVHIRDLALVLLLRIAAEQD